MSTSTSMSAANTVRRPRAKFATRQPCAGAHRDSSRALDPVPFTKELDELVPGASVQVLLVQSAQDEDCRAHLVEIAPAALADLEVGFKSFPLVWRKGAFQIIADDLDQFLAGQLGFMRRCHLDPFQIVFQLPSHLRARTVQQDTLIGLRDRQHVTDVRGGEAFDVA